MRSTTIRLAAAAAKKLPPRRSVARSLLNEACPVSKKLHETFLNPSQAKGRSFSETLSGRVKKLNWQTDIVSETLCDDVIARLAPTLAQHKGATIIDVNPGACVWSRKIHDFLKPERHLLMEPHEAYYEPFVKPLLEQPGSKYTFTNLPGAHAQSYWSNYDKILNDPALLPPQPVLANGDPRLRMLNPNLLVIGNLWRLAEGTSSYKVELAPLILQHMNYGALSNHIFHQAGIVRMLWWVPDINIPEIIAGSVSDRASLNMGLDLGAEVIQVAGFKTMSAIKQAHDRRAVNVPRPGLIEQIARREAQMTATASCELASTSRPNIPSLSADHVTADPNPLETTLTDFGELERMANTLVEDMRPLTKAGPRKSKSVTDAALAKCLAALQYPQITSFLPDQPSKHPYLASISSRLRCMQALDFYMQVLHLEAEYCALAERYPDSPSAASAKEAVLSAAQMLDDLENRNPAIVRRTVYPAQDHLLAAYASPALLPRDRRPFEPLQINKSDLWPPHELSLLLMTPQSRDFSVPGVVSPRESSQVAQEFIRHLVLYWQKPVTFVLNRLAPNAGRDLIAQVPAIVDTRRGGRLDPSRLRARMLSTDMIDGLIRAFLDWPFRPSHTDLLLANSDASTADIDEDDDDVGPSEGNMIEHGDETDSMQDSTSDGEDDDDSAFEHSEIDATEEDQEKAFA